MSWPPQPPPPTLLLARKPGRGRAVTAARTIRPGEIVMIDSPIVVYPFKLSSISNFCSCCFRVLPAQPLRCPSCHMAFFCSRQCLSHSHPSLLCLALPSLHAGATTWPDDALFLLSAYSLPPNLLPYLLILRSSSKFPEELTQTLHSELSAIIPSNRVPMRFSHETTSALLSKEKTNSFALMIPNDSKHETCYGAAGARAYGLYPRASLFNNDCLPNICRFDYIDMPEDNTDLIFRAFDEIKEGSEVCISYVGVTWQYRERQRRLREGYEFKCECHRCKVESEREENQGEGEEDHDVVQIVEGDEEVEEEEEEEEEVKEEVEVVEVVEEEEVVVVEEDKEEREATGEKETKITEGEDGNGEEDLYLLSEFFLKHLCDCGGYFAPLPPTWEGVESRYVECNGCGILKE